MCLLAAGLCKNIQEGCQLYRDAKTQFIEVKKTADEVVVIGKEVHGFIGKIVQFFAGKPTAPKPVAQKKKEKFVAVDEDQILNDVVDNLIQFFHAQQELENHIRTEEEKSRTVYDPNQNHFEAAIKRVRAQDMMAKMVEDIRMALTWNAPRELGALYSKVFEMRDIVGAEQEAARIAQEQREKRRRWQRQQREADRRLKAGISVLTLILIAYLWMWFLYLNQAKNL